MADQLDQGDRRAAFAALASAAIMIAQQVGSKATRDALFLSSFRAEDLPRVVIASAAASTVAVLAITRAYQRWGPKVVVPGAFAISSALYVAEWSFSGSAARPVAVVLYLHTAIFGALVISGFWSVVNERFDPHSAKTIVSRIGTGATAGGVLGGLLAERVGEWADAESMLLALAGLNALAAIGVTQIGGPDRPRAERTEPESALSVLRRAPYLRSLAALVVLTAVSAGLLDYAFKAQAEATFQSGDDLLRFFALFHVGAAVLSFLLQTSIARHALTRLGVAGSVATLPLVVLATAAVSAGFTRLATVVVARATELVLANSIFRSGYELLYTPVLPSEKRPSKPLIDVVGNRGGDALGSGVVIVVIALSPDFAIPTILTLAAVVAVCTLFVARRLHRGYVGQLEGMLRDGTSVAEERQLLEAATLQTLSTVGLDREALFEQLAAQASWSERMSQTPVESVAPPPEPTRISAPSGDPVHDAAEALERGDVSEVRTLLAGETLDARLAPHLIALLARRELYPEAVKALRRLGDTVQDDLVDALTDLEQPFAIRRRLPRVLERVTTPVCAEGLTRGLSDERFEVRYRCAIALARVADRDPALRPPSERIHEVVLGELGHTSRRVWARRRLLDEDTEDAPLLEGAVHVHVHRSVELVFTLLSLAYDPEPLRLSLLALGGEDRTLRGTALEYLENVLREDVRDALFPMLDVTVESRAPRPRQEIVEELVRSMQSLDRQAIEEAIRGKE
ncbi:MAG: Npt1/Npt2 family nucleotide transporter [Sandaracinaceae bacterium]